MLAVITSVASHLLSAAACLPLADGESLPAPVVAILAIIIGLFVVASLLGLRYIPNNRAGVVEKLWSARGSVTDGRIMAAGNFSTPGGVNRMRLALLNPQGGIDPGLLARAESVR